MPTHCVSLLKSGGATLACSATLRVVDLDGDPFDEFRVAYRPGQLASEAYWFHDREGATAAEVTVTTGAGVLSIDVVPRGASPWKCILEPHDLGASLDALIANLTRRLA